MTELLRNAWMGWQDYKSCGKIAALFLIAIFFLLFSKGTEKPKRRFVIYGAAMGMLCIVPCTAVVFMSYQTKFYDYKWIWSIVPVTAVTAAAGTDFVAMVWQQGRLKLRDVCRNVVLTLALAALFLLSGDFGYELTILQQNRQQREDVAQILRTAEECSERSFHCLWAPSGILEYARISQQAGSTLLYGRNMWDVSLNAYSYDTYTPEEKELYLWMEQLTVTGEWVQEYEDEEGTHTRDGSECIQTAIRLGADSILLPGSVPPEELEKLKEGDLLPERTQITRVGEYYLLSVG